MAAKWRRPGPRMGAGRRPRGVRGPGKGVAAPVPAAVGEIHIKVVREARAAQKLVRSLRWSHRVSRTVLAARQLRGSCCTASHPQRMGFPPLGTPPGQGCSSTASTNNTTVTMRT